jgi:hypothetical protein
MSTVDTTTESIKLEDLNFFWTDAGVPCFTADRENIEEIVESFGFNIYYLICNIAEDKEIKTDSWNKSVKTTTTSYQTLLSTGIVKVVKNFVGRAVFAVEKEEIHSFAPVRESAVYTLPSIPRAIVDKLDEFFRLVHAQHGTESIVILTFDPSKDDSSGWGVLVPEQTNTSVHCKYEADSIVNQKPEDVLIVGSVHSHPEMAAYASGTDHADQADFDGIHITYGWQKSVNGGATQYHIELQMSGCNWILKPEDVFESFTITKDPDPEVVVWSQNVKKALPPTGGSAFLGQPQPALRSSTQLPLPQQRASTLPGTIKKGDSVFQNFPDPKDPDPYIVIAEMDFENERDSACLSCGYDLSYADMANGFCVVCDIPIADCDSSYGDILRDTAFYLKGRDMSDNRSYYLWTKDKNGTDLLLKMSDYSPSLFEETSSVPLTLFEDTKEIDTYSDYLDDDISTHIGYSPNRLVCCDLPINQSDDCVCPTKIHFNAVVDFDTSHPYDVYSHDENCADCDHYYSRSCPLYHEAIVNFATTGEQLERTIGVCESFVEYDRTKYSYY